MAFSLFGLSTLVTFLLLAGAVYFFGPKFMGKKYAMYAAVGLIAFGLISGGGISIAGLTAGGAAAGVSGTAGAVSTGTPRQLDSLDTAIQEKFSNSFGNVDTGTIAVFKEDVDPQDPNAVPLFRSNTITDGRQTNTTGVANLKTNTVYRVIYDAGATPTFYSKDFGKIQLADSGNFVGADTVEASLEFEVLNIATLTDIFDEAGATTILNGQAATNHSIENSSQLPEIGCDGTGTGETDECSTADESLIYNQTNADGSVYLDLTFETTGSNEGAEDLVICWFDTTGSELEDNEISSSTLQLRTGTDFGIPSSVTNFITNEECIKLDSGDGTFDGKTIVKSGKSSTYRWTISVTEANINAGSDVFNLALDDLGERNGKDIALRTGAAVDDVTIDLR